MPHTDHSPTGATSMRSLLTAIRTCRDGLAAQLVRDNPDWVPGELEETVRGLVDGILFLRVLESRGHEPRGSLWRACQEPGVHARLTELFDHLGERYGGTLFPRLDVAKKPPKEMPDDSLRAGIARLCPPERHDFTPLSPDALGLVHEALLGDVLVVDDAVRFQSGRGRRKAGGVFYSPQVIVDHVVSNTLGPLLQAATPRDLANLRVLDPACGGGAFLLGVFRHLVARHGQDRAFPGARLPVEQQAKILLDNVFGVDLDPRAVDVAKLALTLDALDGETRTDAAPELFRNLGANIRHGNAVIGVDYDGQDRDTVAPFDWRSEFPRVFGDGGTFSAVVGNPPYLNIDAAWGKGDPRLEYIKKTYPDVHTDKTDLLFYFLARAVEVCDGELGLIVSRSFLEANKARKLRGWLGRHIRVREVLDFRDARVFAAGISTAIVRLTHAEGIGDARFRRLTTSEFSANDLVAADAVESVLVPQARIGEGPWNFGDEIDTKLMAKIDAAGDPLGSVLHVGQGMQTGCNDAFEVSDDGRRLLKSMLTAGLGYRRARTRDISPFELRDDGPMVLYVDGTSSFADLPAAVRRHLEAHRDALESRAAFQRGNCEWWRFTWPLNKKHFSRPKILCPYRARGNAFAVDDGPGFIGLTDTTVLYDRGQSESLHYLAAVLNSNVLAYRHRFLSKLTGGGVYEFFENTVSLLPIPRRAAGDPQHDRIVLLATELCKRKRELRLARAQDDRKRLEAEVATRVETLDVLVAEVFGLDDQEREIVNMKATR